MLNAEDLSCNKATFFKQADAFQKIHHKIADFFWWFYSTELVVKITCSADEINMHEKHLL